RQGTLSESNIKEASREIKLSLLEADVNYKVVKKLISKVKERSVGQEVLKSISPGQQFVKIFHEELIAILGESDNALNLRVSPPAVILMAGLQGSGKTTTAAKIAAFLRKKMKKTCLLAACDVYRPAAVDQLEKLGAQLGIEVFSRGTEADPVDIASEAVKHAEDTAVDVVIIDTAGRTQIDENLMNEIDQISKKVSPHEILFVADAMTGQDAVNVSEEFHRRLGITGVVLSKMDGDSRGGAALSINAVTGAPVKFIGTGEKTDALQLFHPERIASRILGMGDVLSLVEKAQDNIDQEEAEKMQAKMKKNSFDLEDFLSQMKMMKKMGPMEDILKMIPGVGKQMKKIKNKVDFEKEMKKIKAIIQSMTKIERRKPEILNASRRRRIAKGSGTTVRDINSFMKQYREMKKMMKKMNKLGIGGMMKKFKNLKGI
ncbi:MAG: signal recognition particle protein, partial [bacterium]